jgi:hypothetical protein
LSATGNNSTLIFKKLAIAHDKGKPVARRGRKAVNLSEFVSLITEIVWLPKAIGEKPKLLTP